MLKKSFFYIISIVLLTLFSHCESDDDVAPAKIGANNTGGNAGGTGQGGSLARFAIVGETMYFVDNSQITVYDVSNAQKPVQINQVAISSNTIETIYHQGDYLYLGSSNGMFIYSISNPNTPRYLSMATHVSGCDPVVSDGTYAYVTVRNTVVCSRNTDANILEIYNVTNPENPQIISRKNLTQPAGLAIDGDILFVCDDNLEVYDVSDRSNPQLIKTVNSNAIDIIIDGNNILTIDNAGVSQYSYDRATLTLTLRSRIES